MKLVYTEQALKSLEELLEFIASQNVEKKVILQIRNQILDRADLLIKNPSSGRREVYLEHLGLNHRRVIISHYKIIYRVIDQKIYVTDIFDTRQDPQKMKY